MATQQYKASLSKGRSSWCMIFRHPLRLTADGKPGLRVRRGLGTTDQAEAQRLVDQTNEILARQELWSPVAKENATRSFDSRVVAAFYHNLDPSEWNPWSIRDGVITLPGQEQGYVRAMFVGTTGAGKTTLIRQLIGTDPVRERYPSTSAAKTTVADTEIILNAAHEFRSVVTFLQKEAVQLYVEECVMASVLAGVEQRPLSELAKRLLEHTGQRFRLSYILGTLQSSESKDVDFFDEDDDDDVTASEEEQGEVGAEERVRLQEKLRGYLTSIATISGIAAAEKEQIATTLDIKSATATREDRETLEELLEDSLRQNDLFLQIVDDIMDDVESRFDIPKEGAFERGPGGWPSHWMFSSRDRMEFIRVINRFSSNYAPNYGRLLTPVVEGIRVSGPFQPTWAGDRSTRLVLMDGEGLGHTPDSTMSLSSSTTRRFEFADAVVLVDNAAQPMQGSPLLLLRTLTARGQEEKLVICFTHFENVIGDNLPGLIDKKNHVLSSLDNTIRNVGEVLGRSAEAALKRITETSVVFLAGIDKLVPQEPKGRHHRFSQEQLIALLDILETKIVPPKPGVVSPMYDDASIVLNIQQATKALNDEWLARIGLHRRPNIEKEHWARIKGLTRRLGELGEEEYLYLRPIADMSRHLTEHLSRFLSEPVDWLPAPPADDEQMRAAVTKISRSLAAKIDDLSRLRMLRQRLQEWQTAYSRRGTGSAFVRASDIASLFSKAAPVPGEISSLDTNAFTREVRQLVREAITANGGQIYQEK